MKKVLIAAVALMMGASLSLAGMGIQWSNGGWMAAYGGDASEGPFVLDSNEVIWQFIYAGADNVANEPDLAAADYLGGDDQLLAKREIPMGGGDAADGTSWDNYLMQQAGDTLYQDLDWAQSGYVYQRVWQGTPSNDIAENYYFDTDVFAIDTSYAAGSPSQVFDYDTTGNGVVVDKVIPGEGPQPQVPEPATMSLLGLGALAMVLRRKLRK